MAMELSNKLFPVTIASDSQGLVSRSVALEEPGSLLEMQILGLHFAPTESETLGLGPNILVLPSLQVIQVNE